MVKFLKDFFTNIQQALKKSGYLYLSSNPCEFTGVPPRFFSTLFLSLFGTITFILQINTHQFPMNIHTNFTATHFAELNFFSIAAMR